MFKNSKKIPKFPKYFIYLENVHKFQKNVYECVKKFIFFVIMFTILKHVHDSLKNVQHSKKWTKNKCIKIKK